MVRFLFIISWVAFISTTYVLGISILETLGHNFDSLIEQLILIVLVLVTIMVAQIGYERLLYMTNPIKGICAKLWLIVTFEFFFFVLFQIFYRI